MSVFSTYEKSFKRFLVIDNRQDTRYTYTHLLGFSYHILVEELTITQYIIALY